LDEARKLASEALSLDSACAPARQLIDVLDSQN